MKFIIMQLIEISTLKNDEIKNCFVGIFDSSCSIANLNQRDITKQLLTPLRFIAHMNFSLKNYSFELFHLTGRVGKDFYNSCLRKLECE